jgi:hypothetical protein
MPKKSALPNPLTLEEESAARLKRYRAEVAEHDARSGDQPKTIVGPVLKPDYEMLRAAKVGLKSLAAAARGHEIRKNPERDRGLVAAYKKRRAASPSNISNKQVISEIAPKFGVGYHRGRKIIIAALGKLKRP